MLYKVWSKDGESRKWCYDFFLASVDGAVYSYDMEGQTVRSAIFIVKKPIPQDLFDHFFFDYELLSSD
ncbi:hypothetical protein [Caproiciproducens sp. LBM24188]|nr:hypothetical protein [Oscillospiraceae bacterium]HHV31369.1 hypothetical protein [Clostridiales bacterium]